MEMQFINVFNSRDRKTGSSRRLVRSYAMRSVRQRQRLMNQGSSSRVQPPRSHSANAHLYLDRTSEHVNLNLESSPNNKVANKLDLSMPREILSVDRDMVLGIPASLREGYATMVLNYCASFFQFSEVSFNSITTED
jgi:hypothetical protein